MYVHVCTFMYISGTSLWLQHDVCIYIYVYVCMYLRVCMCMYGPKYYYGHHTKAMDHWHGWMYIQTCIQSYIHARNWCRCMYMYVHVYVYVCTDPKHQYGYHTKAMDHWYGSHVHTNMHTVLHTSTHLLFCIRKMAMVPIRKPLITDPLKSIYIQTCILSYRSITQLMESVYIQTCILSYIHTYIHTYVCTCSFGSEKWLWRP
jgi:hypothetical protein